jgi:predicted nucleotidyltransferase
LDDTAGGVVAGRRLRLPREPREGLDARSIGQVDAAIDLVRGVLGEDAVAAYLYGSAVLGGLKPSSDLDLFVVSRRPTTRADKRALIDGLLPISGSHAVSGPARSIELTMVVQSEVRPWRYPPQLEFLYGDWLRSEFERGEVPAGPRPNPDLAVLITILLIGSRPLFGPPAAEVFDPVPHVDLQRALLDVIPGLLGDLTTDTGNVILTLARIWATAATGEIRSKDGAADWALARLPEEHRSVVARARAIYLGDEPEDWQDLRGVVGAHADVVVREIRRLGPGA